MDERLAIEFVKREIDEPLYNAEIHYSGEEKRVAYGTSRLYYCSTKNKALIAFYGELDCGFTAEHLRSTFLPVTVTAQTVGGSLINILCIQIETKDGERGYINSTFEPVSVAISNGDKALSIDDPLFLSSVPEQVSSPGLLVAFVDPIKHLNWRADSSWVFNNDWKDHLSIEYGSSTVVIEPVDELHSRIEIRNSTRPKQAEELLDAVIDSLSFFLSYNYKCLCTVGHFGDLKRMYLNPSEQNRRKVSAVMHPVPPYETPNPIKPFLEKAIPFFLKDDSVNIRKIHTYLIDTSNLSLDAQEMACGIAVEGMFSFIIDTNKDHALTKKKAEDQKTYSRFVKLAKTKIEELITEEPQFADYKDRIMEELAGRYENAASKLKRAASMVGVKIDAADLKQWKNLRDAAAHSRLDNESDFIKRTKAILCSRHIFFQLFLGLIGWEGPYFDKREMESKIVGGDTKSV